VHLTNNNSFSKVKKDIPRCASEEAANTEDNFCAVKKTKKNNLILNIRTFLKKDNV